LDNYAEAEALLKILELGERNIREGKTVPASEAMKRLRLRAKAARPRKQP
jgi:hypothetical protein